MPFSTPKLAFIALFSAILLSGCGTMANLEGIQIFSIGPPREEPTKALGGVARDAKMVALLASETWENPLYGVATCPLSVLFIADMSISLVGDLVSLPIVINGKAPVLFKQPREDLYLTKPPLDEPNQVTPASPSRQ